MEVNQGCLAKIGLLVVCLFVFGASQIAGLIMLVCLTGYWIVGYFVKRQFRFFDSDTAELETPEEQDGVQEQMERIKEREESR